MNINMLVVVITLASTCLLASLSMAKAQIARGDTTLPSIPVTYQLPGDDFSPVYPNPFNPTTTVGFSIKENKHVKIVIYNMLGQEVVVLTDEDYMAGKYSLKWTAAIELPSGVYLCRIVAGEFIATRKMNLVR